MELFKVTKFYFWAVAATITIFSLVAMVEAIRSYDASKVAEAPVYVRQVRLDSFKEEGVYSFYTGEGDTCYVLISSGGNSLTCRKQ